MLKLTQKTALITGASRGIGRAIALEFAKQGITRLILVARNQERLADVAAELKLWNVEVIIVPLDLTQMKLVASSINHLWRQYGPIDILVNCAGVAHQAPFLQAKLPQVYEEIALNLLGTYTVTRFMARRMASRREGLIVNVSSLMGKVAAPTMATYSATKFALLGFSQALRSELAPYNVRVVSLLPSLTDTEMVRKLELFRWVKSMTPSEVAQALVRGLAKGSSEIVVGWQGNLALWFQRLAPWLVEKLVVLASPVKSSLKQALS